MTRDSGKTLSAAIISLSGILLLLLTVYFVFPWVFLTTKNDSDSESVVLKRTVQRTLRESRERTEATVLPVVPISNAIPESDIQMAIPSASSVDWLPEGYSLGSFQGLMQQVPRQLSSEPELDPNPEWMESRPAAMTATLLRQAASFDRDYTFAVLRTEPATDLSVLNQLLLPLSAEIVGSSGKYVRVMVPAEARRLEAIAELPGVLGIGAVPPALKADAAFMQHVRSESSEKAVPVFISLMAPDPAGEWREKLSDLGVVAGAYDADLHIYTSNMPPMVLERLIAADFVLAVEPVPVVQSNHASAVPVMGVDSLRTYDADLQAFSGQTGSGITVGVLDTGLNLSHQDINYGRDSICGENFVPEEDWDLWLDMDNHGTHVFGTIAGAGRTNPLLAGMAPGLSHLRFGKVLSARGSGSGDDIRRGMDYLAHPSTCVWQDETPNAVKPLIVNMSLAASSLRFSGRGVGERKLDSVVHAYSQLYVVAQSNNGLHGFSNYGTAKNSLSVGAVNDSGIIASFSSHGPTADGRLAPNVVATGVNLTSARGGGSSTGHNTFSGTSMAAPSVAGVGALLMQARPEFRNEPALTRARLMASAIRPEPFLESEAQFPVDNSNGPGLFNRLYGLGLVSGRTSLMSSDEAEGWVIGSAISEPDNENYEFIDVEVPRGTSRLHVVLTWDEQPADTLTRSVLNDLDLWLDRGANCSTEACGEYSSRSRIDNVEWVSVKEPEPGRYRIKVVPVETYGEESTAAVAWKLITGSAEPELELSIEDISENENSEYITLDVTVNANSYVASGTTLHFGCRQTNGRCWGLREAYRPALTRILREDGLEWSNSGIGTWDTSINEAIPLGEIASGTPGRVQLVFHREDISTGTAIQITASSWNSRSASQSFTLSHNNNEPLNLLEPSFNDDFFSPENIAGITGEKSLDLTAASRQPGEPWVSAKSRTVWFKWSAPSKRLFRFKLSDADTGKAEEAELSLFTGDHLVDIELKEYKEGSEISFAAQAETEYRLRIATEEWDLEPLLLEWEAADVRPGNDNFGAAQVLEGERSQIDSSNEGATLEGSEFIGGAAASVWFEWTAPEDGSWKFETANRDLSLGVFHGTQIEDIRLLSQPGGENLAFFEAQQGETYRIMVASKSADASGRRFTLNWEPISTDNNNYFENADRFEDAFLLEGAEGKAFLPVNDAGHGLTVEPGEPLSSGIGTAWAQWRAPASGRFTWRIDGTSVLRLSVFTGESLTELELVENAQGGTAFAFDAKRDTSYWIAVGQLATQVEVKSPEAFNFHWGPTPENDDRSSASLISNAGGSATANLTFATVSARDPLDNVGTESVWWHWRAPRSGWHRFFVEGNPLSAILSVYPGDGSNQAIAESERSYIANGRVEAYVLAGAGQSYDVRLSIRPGVNQVTTASLGWEPVNAPPFLAYRGATETDSLSLGGEMLVVRSPLNLAASEDGGLIFTTAENGIFAFRSDPGADFLELALRTDESSSEVSYPYDLNNAYLWWNSQHKRLMVLLREQDSFSLEIPDEDSTRLMDSRIAVESENGSEGWDGSLFLGSENGRFFFATTYDERLNVYQVDSVDQFTLVQEVSSVDSETGVESLLVDSLGNPPFHLALSRDNAHLYLVSKTGLFVFAVNSTSGRLRLVREILFSGTLGGPFQGLGGVEHVAIDSQDSVIFVAGPQNVLSTDSPLDRPFLGDMGIVAFDIEADPTNPRYLGTLTRNYAERNFDVLASWSHLKPSYGFERLQGCHSMLPHAGFSAVDVFCENGFFVAHWNRATASLEVADFAIADESDRFGNVLPYSLGWESRQMAQSPDGGRIYRTTSMDNGNTTDAIHMFERANAKGFQQQVSSGSVAISASGQTHNQDVTLSHGSQCVAALWAGDLDACTSYLGRSSTDGDNDRGRFVAYASTDFGVSPQKVFSPGEVFNVHGSVFVDPSDQGKTGAVHIAAVTPRGEVFAKDTAGNWQLWNDGELPAAHVWDSLPGDFDIIVFGRNSIPFIEGPQNYTVVSGQELGISSGILQIYIAYSTTDNSDIYHYSNEPVTLRIESESLLDNTQ